MGITHTTNISVSSDGGGSPVSGSFAEVGVTETKVDETFSASTTDQLVTLAFSNSALQDVIFTSTTNMTLKFNSSTSPLLTINLVAGVPYHWNVSGGYFTNPFSAAVTALYVSCASAGRLKVFVLTT